MADGSLIFDTKIDTNGFESGTNSIKRHANGLTSVFKKLGAVIVTAFAAKKILDVGKQALEIASDVQEVQNVVDTAFGDMSYKMEQFADTAIETYGISKLTAKQMGSTYMAMGKGMGMVGEAASDMALSLTGRAADIASFYNKTTDEANTLIKSIYTGETEALKAIGVVMTEANLQNYAYTQGINKKLSAMTQVEKVQLRYAYVMEQTSLAAGDFAKTSDSWANQTRMLSEKWKEFLSILGTGLIQVLTPVVKFLNTAMSYLIKFANTVSSILSSVFGFGKQVSNIADTTGKISSNTSDASSGISGMGDSAKDASKKVKKSLSSFDELNVLSQNTSESTADMSNALGGIGGIDISLGGVEAGSIGEPDTSKYENALNGFIKRVQTNLGLFKAWIDLNFKPIWNNLLLEIQPKLNVLKGTFEALWANVPAIWSTFITFIGGSFTQALVTYFTFISGLVLSLFDCFNLVFTDITTLIEPLIEVFNTSFVPYFDMMVITIFGILNGLLDTFVMVFTSIWEAVFPMIEAFVIYGLPVIFQFCTETIASFGVLFTEVKAIFDMLWKNAVEPVLTLISKIWSDLMKLISDFWEKWGKPIFENFNEMVHKMGSTLSTVWEEWLKPVWDKFMSVVDEVWDKHLKPFLANFLDLIGEIVNGAMSIYNKFIDPILKWLINILAPGFKNTFDFILDVVSNLVSGIIEVADGIITTIKGIVQFITGVFTLDWEKAWTGVKNIFKGVFDSLVGIVKTPINLIIDIINGMIGGIVAGVNSVIRAINSISFSVPDWIPGIGGNSIGFNLSEMTAPKIPKLATGAVIPPNSEFLAILGDQKKGTNIEAPLDTIVEAFKKVVGESGQKVELTLNFDGSLSELARILKPALEREDNRVGVKLVTGGA